MYTESSRTKKRVKDSLALSKKKLINMTTDRSFFNNKAPSSLLETK